MYCVEIIHKFICTINYEELCFCDMLSLVQYTEVSHALQQQI